jgi:hypothetical protein
VDNGEISIAHSTEDAISPLELKQKLLRGFSIVSVLALSALIIHAILICFNFGIMGIVIASLLLIAAPIALNIIFFFNAKQKHVLLQAKDAIRTNFILLIFGGIVFILGGCLTGYYYLIGARTSEGSGVYGIETLPFWGGVASITLAMFMTAISAATFAILKSIKTRKSRPSQSD